jgi:hypothetical protein
VKTRPIAAARTAAAVVLTAALHAACGATPEGPPAPIDMGRELRILFSCAETTLTGAGYTIDWRDETTRRLMTEWRPLDDGRHRASVQVGMHPQYGPGVTARLLRETPAPEAGEGSAAEPAAAAEWTAVPPDASAQAWEEGYLAEVQECWRVGRAEPDAQADGSGPAQSTPEN